MTGYIYKITNTVNGKVYIGQTIQDPQIRFKAHAYELNRGVKKNRKFQNAWNKYGEESFEFSVVLECDEKDLNEKEREYIQKYDSFEHGYNATIGGNEVMERRKHRNQSKEKLRSIQYKRWESEDYRERMSDIHSLHRKIICVNTGDIFETPAEASKWANVSRPNLIRSCNKIGVACGHMADGTPMIWAWADEYNGQSVEDLHKGNLGGNNRKRVKNLDTGDVYKSAREAGRAVGICGNSISGACLGKYETARGYRWAYV